MTIAEAIERVDALLCNDYSRSDKIQWLSMLDWKIKTTIIDGHETISFFGYNNDTPLDTDLLAPPAYDDLYLYWLETKIHYYNGDNDQFNAAMILFNSMLDDLGSYYNRTYRPRSAGRFRF